MLVDIHAHLWGGKYERDKAAILAAMEQYGINRVYVSGLSAVVPDEEQVAEANRQAAGFVREHPAQIRGYVYVSPEHKNAEEVLRRGIEEQGLDGVKLWISTLCDAPQVDPLAERMIDYGVPLLIHAFHKATWQFPNESVGANVAVLARRYPELKIIMAHLGGNCYNGIPAIRDLPNVWVDYSGSLYRDDELSYALENVGAERILHGTDMPGTCLVSVGQLHQAGLSCEQRELISHRNAERVFDRNFKLKG